MDEAKWYVAHTYLGYENKVASSLQAVIENRSLHDLIQDVKVPTEITVEIKDGKRKESEHKLYPSYVFVKMILTDETWYIVRNTRGVTGFVGASSQKPSPLSDREVENLGIEVKKQTIDFKVGDQVEIIDGTLAGFVGEVTRIDTEAMLVKVMVSMFGRETEMEMDLLGVRPIQF